MGARKWFREINSTNPEIVKEEWQKICDDDKSHQREYTLQLIDSEGWDKQKYMQNPLLLDELIAETSIYNESPISFDTRQFIYKDFENIQNEEDLKNKISDTHKKWDAAIAVVFDGKTIIGGWVSS